jgi:flavin-dependent dehydrogenase
VNDLVIVGGGPAGLATAIAARLEGLSVVVLDKAPEPGIDKACGEGLMPDAVECLRALGVALPPGMPLRGIRYVDGPLAANGAFPGPPGLGVRRPALHRALAERAREVGAELRWGVAADGLIADGVEASGKRLAARVVVGADGLHSRVRRWGGLETAASQGRRGGAPPRFGVRRHYGLAPWTDHVEVHFGDRCEAYVTPVGDDEVGVAILWSGRKARFDALLANWPALAARLTDAPIRSRDRGAGPLHQAVPAVQCGRVALVGDASGYLDAITGEGIAVALHQAAALATAISSHRLDRYHAVHRRIGRLPGVLTRLVLALDRRPALRRRALAGLAAEPAMFSRLLGVHARSLPPRDLAAVATLRLLARVAAA